MDPCCCFVCAPCKPACPELMCCQFFPPCNVFVDPCNPCDSSVYDSPICNKKIVENGARCGKKMFCKNGKDMKYYTVDC